MQHTELLYETNSYLSECDAVVLDCSPHGAGQFALRLDQTVFFPTAGGQPHDTGFLGDVPVVDVIEAEGGPLHITNAAIAIGTPVRARIDWPRRFDFMQQHSAEHILSFAAHEGFGAVNVGFHMAEAYSTVDFDRAFSEEELLSLEEKTNAYLHANLPIEVAMVSEEELPHIPLRKAAKGLKGPIRIVSMPGGDSCTCCAPHLSRLGEAGQLKIIAAEAWKGGTRLTFLAGMRALHHAARLQRIAGEIAKSFSAAVEDAPEAVKKLQREEQTLRRENKALWGKIAGYMAEGLYAAAPEVKGTKLIVSLLPDLPAAQLKPLAQALTKRGKAMAVLAAPNGEQLSYLLAASDGFPLDMGEAAQAVNAALNGRGGGRGTLAQGSAKRAPGAEEAFKQLEGYFMNRIKHG